LGVWGEGGGVKQFRPRFQKKRRGRGGFQSPEVGNQPSVRLSKVRARRKPGSLEAFELGVDVQEKKLGGLGEKAWSSKKTSQEPGADCSGGPQSNGQTGSVFQQKMGATAFSQGVGEWERGQGFETTVEGGEKQGAGQSFKRTIRMKKESVRRGYRPALSGPSFPEVVGEGGTQPTAREVSYHEEENLARGGKDKAFWGGGGKRGLDSMKEGGLAQGTLTLGKKKKKVGQREVERCGVFKAS